MSNINISDISKEDFKYKKEGKDKEKETSNLLGKNQILKGEQNTLVYNLDKDNELIYFLLLGAFIIIIFSISGKNPNPESTPQDFMENTIIHGIESYGPVNSFANRYKKLYPEITLEIKNEFPTLDEILRARILYVNNSILNNKYIKHVKPIDEKEEEKFQVELYKNMKPNDTFINKRENISNPNFIKSCQEGKLIMNNETKATDKPLISIIIPVYGKKDQIYQSIRSIENQSLKNIEIIIVDDFSPENLTNIYNDLMEKDPRVRIFYHLRNMGLFKSQLDGFLYSRGKYILFFNIGDLLADDLVLEDIYNLIIRYNLDSIRFAFKLYKNGEQNIDYLYPAEDLKIKYGKVNQTVDDLKYRTIFNRLIRRNVITKGLDLVDSTILNAYKNFREDAWWNELINSVSFSQLIVNRIGYMCYNSDNLGEKIKIETEVERDRTMREFIYSWVFEYQLSGRDSSQKYILDRLKKFNLKNNTFNGIPINLGYLNTNFTIYTNYLNSLYSDFFIEDINQKFLGELINNYTDKIINITNYLNSLNATNSTSNNLLNSNN